MDDSQEPDSFERRVRFGCGFVFGAFVTFIIALNELAEFTSTFWALFAGVAVVFGFLAMRYGDALWRGMSRWLWWWRWW